VLNYAFYQNPKNYEGNNERTTKETTNAQRREHEGNNKYNEYNESKRINELKEKEKEKKAPNLVTLYGQVKVKRSKYQTLIEKYGKDTVNDKAEDMDNWCKSKGKSYTNYGAALHNWLKKDAKKEQEKKDKPMSAKTKRDADGTDWIFENMG